VVPIGERSLKLGKEIYHGCPSEPGEPKMIGHGATG
jgi:hypothetical protein